MGVSEPKPHDCGSPSLLVRLQNKAGAFYPGSVDVSARDRLQAWFIKYVHNSTHVAHNKLVLAIMEGDWSFIDDMWSLEIIQTCAQAIVDLYE
jgi:hypothetical protein